MNTHLQKFEYPWPAGHSVANDSKIKMASPEAGGHINPAYNRDEDTSNLEVINQKNGFSNLKNVDAYYFAT